MAIRITKVYTRHGDKGETHLVGGRRVPKDDPRIESYGTIDELNAILGIVRSLNDAAQGLAVRTPPRRDPAAGAERALRPRQRARDAARRGVGGHDPRRRRAGRDARAHHRRVPGRPRAAQVVHSPGRRLDRGVPPSGPHRLPPRRARHAPPDAARAAARGAAAVREPAVRPALRPVAMDLPPARRAGVPVGEGPDAAAGTRRQGGAEEEGADGADLPSPARDRADAELRLSRRRPGEARGRSDRRRVGHRRRSSTRPPPTA